MAVEVFVVVDVFTKATGVHIFSLVPLKNKSGDFINTQSPNPILVPNHELKFFGGDVNNNSATIQVYNTITRVAKEFYVSLTGQGIPFDAIIYEDAHQIVDGGCISCTIPDVYDYDRPDVKQQKEEQRVETIKAAIWEKIPQKIKYYNRNNS